MRSCFVLLALGFFAIGCSSQATIADFGTNPPGCFAPSACYALTCGCTRAGLSACVVCDPRGVSGGNCDCAALDAGPSACLEEVQVCVGRGPVCTGAGARCLAAGSTCAMSGGTPPELAATSTGGTPGTVPRCAYVDDVCCAGPAPDASVPILDMATVD